MADKLMTGERILSLCRECAREVWSQRPPSSRYAEDVARLMMGTAATESHFVWRRQRGFSLEDLRGAWGLWQTERYALQDSVTRLRRDAGLRSQAGHFLFGTGGRLDAVLELDVPGLLKLVHDWDRFAVLMCRLHYYRFPEAVPGTAREQAAYWKKYYNTHLGAGTVEKYMADYLAFVTPVLDFEERARA